MKIRLIDIDGKIDQTDLFVLREPKEGEYLYSRNGRNILVTEVYQFAKSGDANSQEEPDFVAMIQYNGDKPVSEMTNQDVLNWFENPESGLLDDDHENL